MTTVAQVDQGFYVASREGEFIGYIDTTADGCFVAFDGRSTPIGRYATLADAKAALFDPPVIVREKRARVGHAMTVAAASVAGFTAIASGLAVSLV